MTRDEALKAADAVLALVNSRPRMPTRVEVAVAIENVVNAALAEAVRQLDEVEHNCPCGKWHGSGQEAEKCHEPLRPDPETGLYGTTLLKGRECATIVEVLYGPALANKTAAALRNWCMVHDQSVMECPCPQWPQGAVVGIDHGALLDWPEK